MTDGTEETENEEQLRAKIEELQVDLIKCDAEFAGLREQELENRVLEKRDGMKRVSAVPSDELRAKSQDTRAALAAAESRLLSMGKREKQAAFGSCPAHWPEEPSDDEKLTAERVEWFVEEGLRSAWASLNSGATAPWATRCAEILRAHVED